MIRRIQFIGFILGFMLVALLPGALTSAQGTVTVTALYDGLRLRSGPGTQFNTLTTIPYQTKLPALARSADSQWVGVQYQDKRGWVNISTVQVNGDLASLPIKDANSLGANS